MADAKRKTKPAIDAAFLTDAFDAAPQQAELADRQEAINRTTVRAVRDESDVAPGSITWRRNPTRLIDVAHAADLAESIAVHGLIEPIVVDQRGVLLAGGHRLLAVLLLDAPPDARQALIDRLARHIAPIRADQRPIVAARVRELAHRPMPVVRIHRLAIDGEAQPDAALEIEIAENEKRRDYTRAEVRELAKTLEQHGYSFKRGRRAADGKAVSGQHMLELITGKSAATIWRMMTPPEGRPAAARRAPRLRLDDVLAWVGSCDETHARAVVEAVRVRFSGARQ